MLTQSFKKNYAQFTVHLQVLAYLDGNYLQLYWYCLSNYQRCATQWFIHLLDLILIFREIAYQSIEGLRSIRDEKNYNSFNTYKTK